MIFRISAAAFLLVFGGIVQAAAIDQRFDVDAGGQFNLRSSSSKVTVSGSSTDEVRVQISRQGDDAEEIEDDFVIEFEHDADEVTVEIKRKRKNWFGRTRGLLIEVDVPARFDLDIESSGGSVEVRDVTGSLQSRTSGGAIRFEGVDGPIVAQTSGGSITLDGTNDDARLRTSGGAIRVGDVGGRLNARTSGGSIIVGNAGGTVDAQTSGGRIEIESVLGAVQAQTSGGGIKVGIAAQPQSDSELTASGGAVTVLVGPDVAIALDAKASGGRVKSELPVRHSSATKDSLRGQINGGGPLLRLRASGGSVNVRSL